MSKLLERLIILFLLSISGGLCYNHLNRNGMFETLIHKDDIRGQQYFRVKPHDVSVVAGRTAELHCHIGNRAGLVQWSKDGFLLGYDPKIPGYERYEMRVDNVKSAYTLLVHEARLDDEAEYQCQVGPGKNEKPIRSVAKLTVLVPPKHLSINDLPTKSEIEVREGEKVVLQCQALASKPATILKWYRKNIELMPEASRTTVRREGEKLYSTLSSITLYPKGDTTSSTYTCEALHPGIDKSLRTTVGVGVLYPPRHPEIAGYREGEFIHSKDHLTLICTSKGGKPRATLSWFRNEEPVEASFYNGVGRDSSSTLSFTVRDSDNNAVYSCKASNSLIPKPLVAAVKLTVVFPPSQVWILGPTEAIRDEQITVSCRSDASNPVVELGWFIDDVSHQAQEIAVHSLAHGFYTVSNLTVSLSRQGRDVKTFVCVTHGVPRHDKVSQSFNISILYPPEALTIEGYEDGTDLRDGEHKNFKCLAIAGNPQAKLRWFRGETEVLGITRVASGHISSVFSFEVNASDNEISIRCELNNSLLTEPLSAGFKLNVLFPPQNVSISVNPTQPREGDTVRLECVTGSSNPAAHIIWWKEGSLIKERSQTQTTYSAYGGSSTRSHINLALSSSDDDTRFACEAKNDAFEWSVQDEITIRVFYAPLFTTSSNVLDIVEGKSKEVNLTAKANPAVHSYKWSKDGNSIPRKVVDYRHQILSVSAEDALLYFDQVTRHDSGEYKCIARNLEGFASATLTLNVLYPATVFNISGTTEVEEGESVRLLCSAQGNPITDSTITWRRKGEPKSSITSFNTDLCLSILAIVNVTRLDAGVYECNADNGVGLPSIRTTQLTVQYRPTILKKVLQRRVAAGDNDSAELNCIADGLPDVTFAWSFNGSTIIPSHSNSQKYSIRQNHRLANKWQSMLFVKIMGQGDYGVYTCIAGNQFGHDFVTLNIVKKSVPDPPESLKFLNVSHQGAFLSWIPGFNGGLTQTFELHVKKSEESAMTVVHVPMNLTSYSLVGLNQGTTYQVSITAKNIIGESQYSVPITFRTRSLPVMDSTVSGPIFKDSSSVEFLPPWLLAAAVIGGTVVVANMLVCIIYVQRKHWCKSAQRAAGSSPSDDEISGEKMTKKIPSEDHLPFYLTGAAVDMHEEGIDEESFEKASGIKLHQVSRESREDGYALERRCDCGGRQWSNTLICGGRLPGEEQADSQHEQCPDILKRDSCHCHTVSPSTMRISESEVEIATSVGAVMYGIKDRSEWSSDPQTYKSRHPCSSQITLTTFQAKSELPIRHTIIGPKLETVINGHDEDS